MEPEQQKDLDATKARCSEIRENAFSMCRQLLEAETENPDFIKHCGHKDANSAIRYTIQESLKRCDKQWQTFLRKWPD